MPTIAVDAIPTADIDLNCDLDTACAQRLLRLCRDYGEDGKKARKLLLMAVELLEVYV